MQNYTWAASQVVDIAYVSRNALTVRWRETCAIFDVLS